MGLFSFWSEGDGEGFGWVAWLVLVVLALVIVPQCWQGIAFFAVATFVAKVTARIHRALEG